MRRDRSPIPPPREPKRDVAWMRERDMDRRPMPGGRRRSPSPPPYKRHRREDDYYDRHERYSPRRGRSPEYQRYDDYEYYGGGGGGGPPHHQPPPPPRRNDDRRGGGGGGSGGSGPTGPMSFKQFLMERVPDDVGPKQAQDLYDQYLTQHFGNQLRAKFEQEKGIKEVHAAFHPSAFESSLVRHQEGAAAAAPLLAADIQEGKYDYAAPGFHQGLLDGDDAEGGAEAGAKDGAQAPQGPMCLWKPERAARDYKVAKKLVAVVDHQRGLNLADNPLLPQDAIAAASGAGEGGAQGGEGKDAEMEGQGEDAAKPDAATGDADNAAANTGSGAADSEVVLRAVLASIDAEVVSCDEDAVLLERLGQLDQLLTWLWRVHGIDFYAGKELLLEADYVDRTSKLRTIRGPRPEEGEEQDEDEAKAELAELAQKVDKVWAARLEQPDPLLQGCQREEIQRRLDDWMESQIKQEGEKKWGSSFSSKFFLEKRFVVKHILNKHHDKLDEHKNVIRDDLYWERYEQAKLAAHEALRKVAKEREAATAAAAASQAGADMGEAAAEWQEGAEGEEGRGAGRGMRGRGMRGGMAGGRGRGIAAPPPAMMGDMPIMDPTQMMMMGGLPGPIILPGPGMMGGMPGAIPLGAPMMFDPSMMAADLGGMPLIIPHQGGGRGMRGGGAMRGRGGRGRGMAAPPGTKLEGPGYLKHYYDLDAPANNRAVLDYGDL